MIVVNCWTRVGSSTGASLMAVAITVVVELVTTALTALSAARVKPVVTESPTTT